MGIKKISGHLHPWTQKPAGGSQRGSSHTPHFHQAQKESGSAVTMGRDAWFRVGRWEKQGAGRGGLREAHWSSTLGRGRWPFWANFYRRGCFSRACWLVRKMSHLLLSTQITKGLVGIRDTVLGEFSRMSLYHLFLPFASLVHHPKWRNCWYLLWIDKITINHTSYAQGLNLASMGLVAARKGAYSWKR